MFHRNENDTRGLPFLDIIDAKKSKKEKGMPGAKQAGSVARPPRKGKPQQVGTLMQQRAPKTQSNPQNVGGKKMGQPTENPTKTASEAQAMRKQKQQVNRPSPKVVKRGK